MLNVAIVNYNDTTGKYADRLPLITPLINAAIADLDGFIVSKDVTLEIAIDVKDLSSYAAAKPALMSGYMAGGARDDLTDSAQVKIRTGEDWTKGTGAQAADILINLSSVFMDDLVYNVNLSNSSMLSYLQSTLEHEIGHGIGFYSMRNKTTGELPVEYQSLFDKHVVLEDGKPYFAGEATVAINGAKVPLTPLGSGSSISHIDTKGYLMGPTGLGQQMSQVEMAIFHDIGYALSKTLVSTDGHTFVIGDGKQTVAGTAAVDLALIEGKSTNYKQVRDGSTVVLTGVANPSDVISLSGVERVKFDDAVMAIDVAGNGGQAYRLYQVAFNRTPDKGGLGYQINALDSGLSLTQVAQNFINSPEFTKTYGSLDDSKFVTQLYQNVLHRAPDKGGLDFHVSNLSNGVTRAQTLVGFSESPENQAALIGVIQNGMEYQPVDA